MAGRFTSWLRIVTAPSHQVERCEKCRTRFITTELGAWTTYRDFPELCNSMCSRDRRSHTNCRGCGPYCPKCAAGLEAELLANREAYGR
jgi:hypothetical protein